MSKLYHFTAKSSLSFRVIHRGREMYVTFSQCFRGCASFFTEDESLARQIRQHRWFREGRIKEVEDTEESKPQPASTPASTAPARKAYTTAGMRFAASSPASAKTEAQTEEVTPAEDPVSEEAVVAASSFDEEDLSVSQDSLLRPEEVTSFMEAKEYITTHFEVDRNALRSKQDLADFCAQHGITFDNYPLNE
jgi:hypothetical protein